MRLCLIQIILNLIFLFSLVNVSSGYQVDSCISTDGEDMGCSCAKTENVTCPPNYYCPEYSAANAQTYKTDLAEASCNVTYPNLDGTPFIQCPCTPGFYCPANTSQPSYCCTGFYCPTDTSITVSDPKGLGTWGSLSFICPENYFCVNGQVIMTFSYCIYIL